MAITNGEERVFVPEVQYKAEHAREIVKVVEAGVMVSRVINDSGVHFAAFNSELRRIHDASEH